MDRKAFSRKKKKRANQPADFLQQWAAVHIIQPPDRFYHHLISEKYERGQFSECIWVCREGVMNFIQAASSRLHTERLIF